MHTFETNMRGPAEPLSFAGHQVSAVVRMAATPGNIGVTFDVLSYAGILGVTVVADPEIIPESEQLTDALSAVYARLAHSR